MRHCTCVQEAASLVSEFHTETLHRFDAVFVLLFNCDSFIMGGIRHMLRHFMIICKCLSDEMR